MSKILPILSLLIISLITSLHANLNDGLLAETKKGVVSIRVRTNSAAYNDMGEAYGTGFIVDRERGVILTNRHVIGASASATYDISFFNGQELEALLLYYDAWQDFAFLVVDPSQIPQESTALELLPGSASLDEPVFIVGKNAGQNFSIQTGQVSNLYESQGTLPFQAMRISLNTRGGGSGSPVLNYEGKVLGLIYSSNMDNFAFAMWIDYAVDALESLKTGNIPTRKSTGALLEYASLDRAVRYNYFPQAEVSRYLENYPLSFNQGLRVSGVLKNTPAEDTLLVGDIIQAVDGEPIGPNLYDFDKAINKLSSEFARITIWRKGELQDVYASTYDTNDIKVSRMLSLGGALFYETDDLMSAVTGAPAKSVFVSNIRPGGSFYDVFPWIPGTDKLFIRLISMDGESINSLDDLIEIVPRLLEKMHFVVEYQNQGFFMGYNSHPYFTRQLTMAEVSYSPLDGMPQVYSYNPETLRWEVSMTLGE